MTSPDPREKESEQYIEQGKDNVLLNIDPTSPPPMKTLVYSPEIKILIARGSKQYDVSADVVAWSLRRPENSIASLVFRLSNKPASNTDLKKLRYNQLFERMDRVTVFLKRIEWVQVFSGYLDSVPHVQIYPGTVNFRASCTLKRLLHTWWDPGLPESQRIFDQSGRALTELENGEMQTDMGLGSLLRRLLVLVGGWNPQNIHIQRFPSGFYDYMEEQIRRLTPGAEKDVRSFKELLLGEGDISMGPGRAAGRQQGITMGGYMVSQPERMLEVIRAVDEMGMGAGQYGPRRIAGFGHRRRGGQGLPGSGVFQGPDRGRQELVRRGPQIRRRDPLLHDDRRRIELDHVRQPGGTGVGWATPTTRVRSPPTAPLWACTSSRTTGPGDRPPSG
jgi:hypothetical protein